MRVADGTSGADRKNDSDGLRRSPGQMSVADPIGYQAESSSYEATEFASTLIKDLASFDSFLSVSVSSFKVS